jgi:hypothetical protein
MVSDIRDLLNDSTLAPMMMEKICALLAMG